MGRMDGSPYPGDIVLHYTISLVLGRVKKQNISRHNVSTHVCHISNSSACLKKNGLLLYIATHIQYTERV